MSIEPRRGSGSENWTLATAVSTRSNTAIEVRNGLSQAVRRRARKEVSPGRQSLMYTEKKHALLSVLQGLDAGGKDGAVNHVFTALNPPGASVIGFKAAGRGRAGHESPQAHRSPSRTTDTASPSCVPTEVLEAVQGTPSCQ